MKKLFISFLTAFAFISISVQPAFAADNIFQTISKTINNQFQRVYLFLPGNKPGNMVMSQAAQSLPNLKSANANTVLIVDLYNFDKAEGNLKLTVTGPMEIKDAYDPATYHQSLSLMGEATMQATTLRAAVDVKVAGRTTYFKVNEAPPIPFFDLNQVKGKWLRFTLPEKNQTKPSTLTAEQQQKLKDAYGKLLSQSQFGDAQKETKNGHDVYVVNAVIPKAAVLEYFQTLSDTIGTKPEADPRTAALQLEKVLDKIGDIKATLWVDRSSFFVRHIELPITYQWDGRPTPTTSESSADPFAELKDVNTVKMLLTTDLDNFNQPVQFDEPIDSQDAQEVFQKMMEGSQPGLKTQTPSSMGPAGLPPSELPKLTPQQQMLLDKYKSARPKATPGSDLNSPQPIGY